MSAVPSRLKDPNWLLISALLLGSVIFLQAFHFDFIFDDIMLIVENQAIQSWARVPAYFTGGMFAHLKGAQSFNFYRPLFLLWLRLNHSLFWMASGWWHLASISAHLLAVFLVFKTMRLLASPTAAGITALLFAVHPIHVEAVTWLSSASEMLYSSALLAAFLCYAKYRENRSAGWLGLLAAAFFCGLMLKETSVVLILLLPFFELCFAKTQWKAMQRAVATMLLVSVCYFMMRHFALGELASVDKSRPFSDLVFTWPALIWFYLTKLLWPFQISFLYHLKWVHSPWSIRFLFPGAAVALTIAALIASGRRNKLVLFAGAVIFVPLLPQLMGIWVYNEYDLVHDRYLYLPALGFCILVALALSKLLESTERDRKQARLAGVIIVAVYCATVVAESPIARNNETVFRRGTEIAPESPVAWNLLAETYAKEGDNLHAINVLQRAFELRPDFWLTNYQLGKSYFELRDYQKAEFHLKEARKVSKGLDGPAVALENFYLGLAQFRLSKFSDAEEAMRRALNAGSGLPMNLHFAMGQILEAQGKFVEAREHYLLEWDARQSPDAAAAARRLEPIIANSKTQTPRK